MQLVDGTAVTTEQPIFHRSTPFTGNHGPVGVKLIALLLEEIQLLMAGDTSDFEGILVAAQNVQARSTDTSGRAKDGNFSPSIQIHLVADANKNLGTGENR